VQGGGELRTSPLSLQSPFYRHGPKSGSRQVELTNPSARSTFPCSWAATPIRATTRKKTNPSIDLFQHRGSPPAFGWMTSGAASVSSDNRPRWSIRSKDRSHTSSGIERDAKNPCCATPKCQRGRSPFAEYIALHATERLKDQPQFKHY